MSDKPNGETRAIPYPPDTRAKGWRFELDYERIYQSDTWALAPADVRPWLLLLWLTAWTQTPCGALPDDDALIAVRVGMPLRSFSKHRAVLMRGWWRAGDGRLYHDVLVERVAALVEARASAAKRKRESRRTLAGVTALSRVTNAGLQIDSGVSHDTRTRTRSNTKPTRAGAGAGNPGDTVPSDQAEATQRFLADQANRGHTPPPAALLARRRTTPANSA